MPGLTAINNTYTANTPSGVRECLYFLQQQQRARRNRDTSPVDVFRSFPVSIVYGCGNVCAGQLVTAGDELDIIPTQWDRIRRRRWWDASRTASKQMLLPFAEHARVRIVSMNRYSHATEIVIQIGSSRSSQLSLTAPRNQDQTPGPYTVRAIRIHNVDRSETVPPMRPIADESCPQRQGDITSAEGITAYVNGDWGRHSNYSAARDDGPQDCVEECRPIEASEADWHTAVVDPNPCREVPGERPVRHSPSGEPLCDAPDPPMWEAPPPLEGPESRREVPRTRHATRAVPIRGIVTREDVDREARNHRVSLQRRGLARVHEIRDSDHTVTTRDIPVSELTREQARAVRDMDMAMAYGTYSHVLGRSGRNDT
jgi:hypothetical protein